MEGLSLHSNLIHQSTLSPICCLVWHPHSQRSPNGRLQASTHHSTRSQPNRGREQSTANQAPPRPAADTRLICAICICICICLHSRRLLSLSPVSVSIQARPLVAPQHGNQSDPSLNKNQPFPSCSIQHFLPLLGAPACCRAACHLASCGRSCIRSALSLSVARPSSIEHRASSPGTLSACVLRTCSLRPYSRPALRFLPSQPRSG